MSATLRTSSGVVRPCPRTPTMPGWKTSGFYRPGRYCLGEARGRGCNPYKNELEAVRRSFRIEKGGGSGGRGWNIEHWVRRRYPAFSYSAGAGQGGWREGGGVGFGNHEKIRGRSQRKAMLGALRSLSMPIKRENSSKTNCLRTLIVVVDRSSPVYLVWVCASVDKKKEAHRHGLWTPGHSCNG